MDKEVLDNLENTIINILQTKIKDIIVKHMFPLNPTPPKYVESWIVTIADKMVSSTVLLHPTQYPKYLGIKRRKNEK